MRTKNGEEYLSSKDACAISHFSEKELRSLCLEGKVKSKLIGEGFFVEKESLLSFINKGNFLPYGNVDLENSLNIWHRRMSKKFGMLTLITIIFLVIFMVPIFFLKNIGISEYDIANVPTSFNSIAHVSNPKGTMAAVGYLNEVIANIIEKGVVSLYDFISSLF